MKKIILSLSCLCASTLINAQSVSTIAGSSSAGFVNGTGSAAQFFAPSGVAVDGSGNIYVADFLNNSVRKITSSGVVTTLAGSGTAGYADGTGSAAMFNSIKSVAVDATGTVYVADYLNHRIRKITPAGLVSTFAGSGVAGYADGTGLSAQFNRPIGITVDAAGDLYIAEEINNRIRKITSLGVVTTLAGNGTIGSTDGAGSTAQFNSPYGIAVDATGNVYVSERTGMRIRKITSSGFVSTLAGSTMGAADGTGIAAQFYNPAGIALDGAGNIYVADENNHRIRKITSTGVVTTFVGSSLGFSDGVGAAAQFSGPAGITVDAAGNIYVADVYNHRIRKITGGVAGINDIDFASNFSIYPNPTNKNLTVVFELLSESATTITITNTLGQIVLTDKIASLNSSFNLEYLESGIYFVNISDSKGNKYLQKIIKE